MNPIHVFAKLAARVPPCDMQPGATSSPDIDASIAAALCAGMSAHAYKAALAKFSQDESVSHWLMVELWRVAMERAQRDGWGTAGKKVVSRCGNPVCVGLVSSLTNAALDSFLNAITITHGADYPRVVAEIIVRETYEPGLWAQANAWQWRAAMLGISKSTYFSAWHKRVQSVGAVMDSWEGEAMRHLWRRQVEA
jgi:hypothetical protein